MATTPPAAETAAAPASPPQTVSGWRWTRILAKRLWRFATRELWHLWLAVAGLVVAALIVHVLAPVPREQAVVYTGAVLQLLGLLAVAWGLRETRKLFDHPSLFAKFRDIFVRPRNAVTHSGVGRISAGGSVGFEGVSATGQKDLDQRVTELEAAIREIKKEHEAAAKRENERINELKSSVAAEEEERTREDKVIRNMLEAAATGGIRIEQAGLVWLLFGIIFTAAPGPVVSLARLVARWIGLF